MSRITKLNALTTRKEIFDGARDLMSKIGRTMNDIERGEHERKACSDNGITYPMFRSFVAKSRIAGDIAKLDEIHVDSHRRHEFRPFTWQEAFLEAVFGPEKAKLCPSEYFNDAFFKHMPDSGILSQNELVIMFFKYPLLLSQSETARILGISASTVRSYENSAESKITLRLFNPFHTGKPLEETVLPAPVQKPDTPLMGTPLKALGLTAWAHNALRRSGFMSVEDIEDLTAEDLAAIKGIGPKSADEIMFKTGSYKKARSVV